MELWNDLPLLVVAAVPRPLIYIHAVSGSVANDIQRLAAVAVDQLVIAAAQIQQSPLLAVGASPGPLLGIPAIGCRVAAHFERLAAKTADDLVIPAGLRHKAPLLVLPAIRSPLVDIGAIRRGIVVEIQQFVVDAPSPLCGEGMKKRKYLLLEYRLLY